MVDHGSTSLLECGPTEYPAPGPCSIRQGKSLSILYGPPISVDMEINYPYIYGWPQKYKSPGMWAHRIPVSQALLVM